VCVGCSGGVDNYLVPSDAGVGGPAKLTLPEAGIVRIYFTDDDGGISVRENNAEFQLISGGDPAFPILSPTAGQLAFVRQGAQSSVEVIAVDGSTSWVIRPDADARSVRWSPDGTMLVFGSFDEVGGGVARVAMFHLAQGEVIDLAFEPSVFGFRVPLSQPVWSPFGRFLAFSVFETEDRVHIDFIDMQDFSRRRVTEGDFKDLVGGWSPSRRGHLAFARRIEKNWFLAIARITGEGEPDFVMGPQHWGGFSVEWQE